MTNSKWHRTLTYRTTWHRVRYNWIYQLRTRLWRTYANHLFWLKGVNKYRKKLTPILTWLTTSWTKVAFSKRFTWMFHKMKGFSRGTRTCQQCKLAAIFTLNRKKDHQSVACSKMLSLILLSLRPIKTSMPLSLRMTRQPSSVLIIISQENEK